MFLSLYSHIALMQLSIMYVTMTHPDTVWDLFLKIRSRGHTTQRGRLSLFSNSSISIWECRSENAIKVPLNLKLFNASGRCEVPNGHDPGQSTGVHVTVLGSLMGSQRNSFGGGSGGEPPLKPLSFGIFQKFQEDYFKFKCNVPGFQYISNCKKD